MKGFKNRHVMEISNSRHKSKNGRSHKQQQLKLRLNEAGGKKTIRTGLENEIEIKLKRQIYELNIKHPFERWKLRNGETITTKPTAAIKTSCKSNTKSTADLKCIEPTTINTFILRCHRNNNPTSNSSCDSSTCANNLKHHLISKSSKKLTNIITNTKANITANTTYIPPSTSNSTSNIVSNSSNYYCYYSTTKCLSPKKTNSLCLDEIKAAETTKTTLKESESRTIATTNTSNSSSAKSALFTNTNDKNNSNNNNESTSYSSTISTICRQTNNTTKIIQPNKNYKTKSTTTITMTTVKLLTQPSLLCFFLLAGLILIYSCPVTQALRVTSNMVKTSTSNKEQLYIGLIAPHTNFGKREYLRAIHTAVSGLNRTRGAKLTFFKDYQFEPRNIRFDMMSLTPSPTGKFFSKIFFMKIQS